MRHGGDHGTSPPGAGRDAAGATGPTGATGRGRGGRRRRRPYARQEPHRSPAGPPEGPRDGDADPGPGGTGEFPGDARPARRRRAGRLPAVLLAIVAAGLAVAVTLTYLELRTLRRNEAAGTAALAAARSYVSDLLSYDHRHIEQDLARAREHATERLADRYRRLAETLIPQARREQAIQQVTVAGAAVESATPERVRVLMLVNLSTSKLPPGARTRKGEVGQGRVRFVMVKGGDGAWLVDDVSTLLGDPPTRT